MTTPRDWDGAGYDRAAQPMTRRGVAAIDRLALRGDETVLDAGCGSGQVTSALLERLPRGGVIALDASPSMLAVARERLGDDPRVRLVEADLSRPLPVEGAVDAVLSTSTFHWVKDHDALFANLAAVLRPGGALVFECGGAGNIASVVRVVRELGETFDPWCFAGPEETTARLERAGFDVDGAWLAPDLVPLAPEAVVGYLETVVLGSHLARLPAERRRPFAEAVAARLPALELDYVRLNVDARRRGG